MRLSHLICMRNNMHLKIQELNERALGPSLRHSALWRRHDTVDEAQAPMKAPVSTPVSTPSSKNGLAPPAAARSTMPLLLRKGEQHTPIVECVALALGQRVPFKRSTHARNANAALAHDLGDRVFAWRQ
jgi:hypothetical protein